MILKQCWFFLKLEKLYGTKSDSFSYFSHKKYGLTFYTNDLSLETIDKICQTVKKIMLHIFKNTTLEILNDALTFTTIWANSADDKLVIFFLFLPDNRIWHFMQIVSSGRQFAWYVKSCCLAKSKKTISKCHPQKILPKVLSLKV